MEQIWARHQKERFSQRTWDDEAIIYDSVSGHTHFLEPVATRLLATLGNGPQSQGQLVDALATDFIFPPEEDLAALTESALAKLQSIDLVVISS